MNDKRLNTIGVVGSNLYRSNAQSNARSTNAIADAGMATTGFQGGDGLGRNCFNQRDTDAAPGDPESISIGRGSTSAVLAFQISSLFLGWGCQ